MTSARTTTTRDRRGRGSTSRWLARLVGREVVRRVGGPARARVIFMLAAVLALNGADAATVGAVAPQLEHALHIGNTKIGLLSSVSLLIGAVSTIPIGFLVDRVRRIPLLSISVVLWSLASLAGAFASSYSTLLLTRLLLGVVIATAGPAIASLTGDYFSARERGRVYAYILGGEIAGNALGFIVSGGVASLIDWRAAFVLLAIPGFFLARELHRTVPEPMRGGQSRLAHGTTDLERAAAGIPDGSDFGGDEIFAEPDDDTARLVVEQHGIEPVAERILRQDARSLGLVASVRYILRIPTNLMLIISSSFGYFYFTGLQTFALLFVRGHYHAGQATAELVLALLVVGALIGTLLSGRLTDQMLRRGNLTGRVWVPAVCYLGACALLVPGFVSSSLTPAIWFDMAGAALLSAANPPLDAARLDIMPPGLWGRAESTRTVARSVIQALAPLLFGGLSQLIAGIFPAQAPIGTHPGVVSASTARGLEISFLILLATLAASGLIMLRARHTYPEDVATAAASSNPSGPLRTARA